jgi:hypothetical protein
MYFTGGYQVSEKKEQEIQLEIQVDDDVAQGIYANLAVINHTDAEFILDFVFVQPQAPRGKVRARIIVSPRHAKRLLGALEDNLRRFEQRFGAISEGPAPPLPSIKSSH